MQKINKYKIYFLALFYLFIPKRIKHYFNFKNTSLESLAIGVTMTKIKYFKFISKPNKMKRELHFPKLNTNNYY